MNAAWLSSSDLPHDLALRALAVFAIVAGHFGLLHVTGGAYFLLLLAGYSFSRFQVPGVVARDSARGIVALVIRVYAPVLLLYAVHAVRVGTWDAQSLLPLRNFFTSSIDTYHFWFVDVYVQLQLTMALLLSSGVARRALASATWVHYFAWFGLWWCLAKLVPDYVDAEPLYNRVPWMLGYLFALGMLIERTRRVHQAALVSLIAIGLLMVPWSIHGSGASLLATDRWWIGVGALALLWGRSVSLPTLFTALATSVAMASLHIYITHMSVAQALQRMAPTLSPWVAMAVALAVGVAFGVAWKWVERRIRTRLLAGTAHTPATQSTAVQVAKAATPATASTQAQAAQRNVAWHPTSVLASEFGPGSRL